MLASSGLAEEGVEGVVTTSDGLVGGHLAVGLDPVLQAVELPAGIADLAAGLADVDRNALTLEGERCNEKVNFTMIELRKTRD